MVLSYLMTDRIAEFGKEIVNRVGEVESVEGIDRWLALATILQEFSTTHQ